MTRRDVQTGGDPDLYGGRGFRGDAGDSCAKANPHCCRRRFWRHFKTPCGALDPLCSENLASTFASLNFAACHACTLVAETSCESGNYLLIGPWWWAMTR